MNNTIIEAKKYLRDNKLTFVAMKEGTIYESTLQGIAPIFQKLQEHDNFLKDAFVVDKVIGKAAAMLLIMGEIKELFAEVISEHALQILKEYEILVTYQQVVPYIINRTKTGMCPMEESVLHIKQPKEAYAILEQKIAQMRKK